MWRKATWYVLGLAVGLGAQTLSAQSVPGWSLVWADEFALPDNSAPSGAKWAYDTGGGGWGNNELETYTSRLENAKILDGKLVIEARQETYTGTDNITRNYTSARLKTKGRASWTCGRIEARMQLPRGQGIWPAFWMLGANLDTAGWPGCGEIDIMENIGKEPGKVHGTIHGPGYSGGNGIGSAYTFDAGAVPADGFHVYAIEWETNRIRWFVDGKAYFTVTPASLPNGATWVFSAPQFVILNLAVGGNWPGNPDGTTVFPQRLQVDYVRVYARTNLPESANVLLNPGFENAGQANWTAFNQNVYVLNGTGLTPHGGTNAVKVYGQFSGAENYTGFFQDTACQAGAAFSAEGWALTPSTDALAGGNSAWMELSFRGVSDNILALYRSTLLTAASPRDAWIRLLITNRLDTVTYATVAATNRLVAPVGAVIARIQGTFRQPTGYDGGAAWFDDAALIPLQYPAPVRMNASGSGSNLQLTFPALPGSRYTVQRRNYAAAGMWTNLQSFIGSGSFITFAAPTDYLSGFFRVQVE